MSSSKRVLTYLRQNQELVLGQFGQCLVSNFSEDNQHEVEVNCELLKQGLVLSRSEKSNDQSVILRHPPFCPMLHLSPELRTKIVQESSYQGISVAVAAIIETLDAKVLLTRRPPHMRTFPNVWVPPGGGSEESETILETGVREIQEETGLDVRKIMKSAEPLCLWESVYPPLLGLGDPKRHQIVVYLHVLVEKSSKDLDVKLDPQETDAFTWLDLEQMQVATDYSMPLDEKASFLVFELIENDLKEVQKKYHVLRDDVPSTGSFDVERISTGTRFALERFLVKRLKSLL